MKRLDLVKRSLLGSVMLLVVGAMIIPGQPANASTDPAKSSGLNFLGIKTDDDAEKIDQQAAASQESSWTQRFSLAVDLVRQELSDSFGGALVDSSQDSGRVWFVGAVPAGVERYFSDVENVSIEGGAAITESAIYQAAADTMDTLIEATDGLVPLATYPVPEETKVVVEFASADEGEVSAALTYASRSLAASGVSVQLSPSETFSIEPELFHGARPLAGVCTGAFPVKRKGGAELGILTAAHCPGTGSYDGTPNAFNAPYPYSISTAAGPGGGDFRWNHSKYGLSGLTFVAGNQAMRVFNSHANPNVGQSICNYGKETDYKCSTVVECGLSTYAPVPDTGQQYLVGGLCRVSAHVTVKGDSGGPWFLGNTAYGVHHGKIGYTSAFSLVNNALSQTRVNLVVDSAGNTVP